jgi:5-methylcytosine-specific restriction enzyme A
MPTKPASPCSYPRCPERAVIGSRCVEHAVQIQHVYNVERGSASSQGYGVEWRKIRDAFLADNPDCYLCGQSASDVDHIIPKRRGGTDDWSNLQALCHVCHSRKTARADGRWGRRGQGGCKSL